MSGGSVLSRIVAGPLVPAGGLASRKESGRRPEAAEQAVRKKQGERSGAEQEHPRMALEPVEPAILTKENFSDRESSRARRNFDLRDSAAMVPLEGRPESTAAAPREPAAVETAPLQHIGRRIPVERAPTAAAPAVLAPARGRTPEASSREADKTVPPAPVLSGESRGERTDAVRMVQAHSERPLKEAQKTSAHEPVSREQAFRVEVRQDSPVLAAQVPPGGGAAPSPVGTVKAAAEPARREQAFRPQAQSHHKPVRAAQVPSAGSERTVEDVEVSPPHTRHIRPVRLLRARPLTPDRVAQEPDSTPGQEAGLSRRVLLEKPARRALAPPLVRPHPMDIPQPQPIGPAAQSAKPSLQPSQMKPLPGGIAGGGPLAAKNLRSVNIDREASHGAASNAAPQVDGRRVQPERRDVPLDKPSAGPRRSFEQAQKPGSRKAEGADAKKSVRTAGAGIRPEMPEAYRGALSGPAPVVRPQQVARPSIHISIATLEIRERSAAPVVPLAAVSPRAHEIDPGLAFGGPVPGRW